MIYLPSTYWCQDNVKPTSIKSSTFANVNSFSTINFQENFSVVDLPPLVHVMESWYKSTGKVYKSKLVKKTSSFTEDGQYKPVEVDAPTLFDTIDAILD